MYKISGRTQKGKGKEMLRMTKFDREMKKLEWNVQEKKRSLTGVVGKGTRV